MPYESYINAIPQLSYSEKLNLLAALVQALQFANKESENVRQDVSILENRAKDVALNRNCAEHELIEV